MKILFFAPHSGIWIHAFPEALVAESLMKAGHEVVYITCGKVLAADCVTMHSVGLGSRSSAQEREAICDRCNRYRQLLTRHLQLPGYDMESVLQSGDYAEVERILAQLTPANCLELEIEGIPVGRYAFYELILTWKKMDTHLSNEEWPEYIAALRGALIALFAARTILDKERPERLVSYNSLYPVNRVWSRMAEARGAMPYFMHAGGNLGHRLQTLMLGRDHTLTYLKALVAEWPRFRNRPCPPELVDKITDHFMALFAGESVFAYSSPVARQPIDIRSRFGVRPDQKLLVATMSSPDERFAASTIGALDERVPAIFESQVEWIQSLVRYVRSRPQLFLLIRVHPREFPNKRERVHSQHAAELTRAFESMPANAAVNWPTDNVALYDLANDADVFLNAWSSAGKEMALLGVPVVCYSADLLFYPAELNYVARDEVDFFAKIEQALERGWDIEHCRSVYRWLAVEYGYGLIDIADGHPKAPPVDRSYAARAARRLRRLVDADYLERDQCRARPRELQARAAIEQIMGLGAATPLDPRVERRGFSAASSEQELATIRNALYRIGAALFGPNIANRRGRLAQRLSMLRPAAKAA